MAELAYATESFVLLRRDSLCRELGYVTPPDRLERLEAFVEGYGLADRDRPELADALVAKAKDRMAFGIQMHREGRDPWATWWAADEGAGDREDLAVTGAVIREWRRRLA